MRQLEEKGCVKIVRRVTNDGGNASNKYMLNLDKLAHEEGG